MSKAEAAIDTNGSILALDVGERRIGVALARLLSRVAQPAGALDRQTDFITALRQLIADHQVQRLVVGLPRGLDGQSTPQTLAVRRFVDNYLRPNFNLSISFQDEALTSRLAEAELSKRRRPYDKADIDALAATYILEDFLRSEPAAHEI